MLWEAALSAVRLNGISLDGHALFHHRCGAAADRCATPLQPSSWLRPGQEGRTLASERRGKTNLTMVSGVLRLLDMEALHFGRL